MARITPFSVGQRWYVDRGLAQSPEKPNFWFVILGPGDTATEKLCLLEIDASAFARSPLDLAQLQRRNRTTLSTYSHAHLKKTGTLVEQTAEAFAASQARCEELAARIRPLRDAERAGGLDYATTHRHHLIMEALVRGDALNGADQATVDGLRAAPAPIGEAPALQAVFDGATPAPSRTPLR